MYVRKKKTAVCFYFRMLLDNQQSKWTEFYTAFSPTKKKYVISSRLCRRNKSCPSIFPFIQFKSDKLLWSSRLIVNQAANFRISLKFFGHIYWCQEWWLKSVAYLWLKRNLPAYEFLRNCFCLQQHNQIHIVLVFCLKLVNFSYSK